MTDDKRTPSEHESIAPAQVTLNVNPHGAEQQNSGRQRHPVLLWFGLSLACFALLGVVFVLPSLIEPPTRLASDSARSETVAGTNSNATRREQVSAIASAPR